MKEKLTPKQIIDAAERQREMIGGDRGLEAYWLTIVTLMKVGK